MRRFKSAFVPVLLALAMLLVPALVEAQVPSGQPVYYVKRTIKVLTLTALGVTTQNSPDIVTYGTHVYCLYNQTAHTSTTQSTVITIYNKDLTSGNYISVLASAAYTADAQAAAIMAGPGLPVTANVSANAPLTNVIRVSAANSGSGSTVTGTVTCTFEN